MVPYALVLSEAHRRCSSVVSDDKRLILRQDRILLQRNRFVSDCGGVCKLRDWTVMAHQPCGSRDRGSRLDESRVMSVVRPMVLAKLRVTTSAPTEDNLRRLRTVIRVRAHRRDNRQREATPPYGL
jgi:hypothetical protein